MTGSLDPILASTRERIDALRPRRAEIERAAAESVAPPPFRITPPDGSVGVIAEIKRRSPSEGDIRADLDPVTLSTLYARGGAVAISVLTEGPHFGGSLSDLERVTQALHRQTAMVTAEGISPPVSVLRKDFVLDELQLFEARAAGAAAVLLIVQALSTIRLLALAREARWLGLATLVEAHTAEEVEGALAVGATVVGVNARDLDTLAVDLRAAEALLPLVPPEVPAVAESGIANRRDVELMAAAGADAVLVGTALARSPDPIWAVRDLTGVPRRGRAAMGTPA